MKEEGYAKPIAIEPSIEFLKISEEKGFYREVK